MGIFLATVVGIVGLYIWATRPHIATILNHTDQPVFVIRRFNLFGTEYWDRDFGLSGTWWSYTHKYSATHFAFPDDARKEFRRYREKKAKRRGRYFAPL